MSRRAASNPARRRAPRPDRECVPGRVVVDARASTCATPPARWCSAGSRSCGLEPEDARLAAGRGRRPRRPHLRGPGSPRRVTRDGNAVGRGHCRGSARCRLSGVFVNQAASEGGASCEEPRARCGAAHGDEDRSLRGRVESSRPAGAPWKVEARAAKVYTTGGSDVYTGRSRADRVLFDTLSSSARGGTGVLDWSASRAIRGSRRASSRAASAWKRCGGARGGTWAIDVCSRIEARLGKSDPSSSRGSSRACAGWADRRGMEPLASQSGAAREKGTV